MNWRVTGADKNTGKDRSVVVKASSPSSAMKRATAAGLLVESVAFDGGGNSGAMWALALLLLLVVAVGAWREDVLNKRIQVLSNRQAATERILISETQRATDAEAKVDNRISIVGNGLDATNRNVSLVMESTSSLSRSLTATTTDVNDAHRRIDVIVNALRRY